jgi:hypothetical protein
MGSSEFPLCFRLLTTRIVKFKVYSLAGKDIVEGWLYRWQRNRVKPRFSALFMNIGSC